MLIATQPNQCFVILHDSIDESMQLNESTQFDSLLVSPSPRSAGFRGAWQEVRRG